MPYKQAFLKGREYLAKAAAISALCLAPIAWAQAPAYILQVAGSGGGGHVSGVSQPGPVLGGVPISCGSQCYTRLHPDTYVVLTATPTEGFRFVGWGEETSDGIVDNCDSALDNTCYLTIRSNRTVRARFAPVAITGGTTCQSRDFSDAEKTMIDAYIAYYGRPPDVQGLNGWAGQLQGQEPHDSSVIADFGDSPEYQNRFGVLNSRFLINNLYVQIFGRPADNAGLNWYEEQLYLGGSLATIAMEILRGAAGDDAMVLENRRKVARHFVTVSDGRNVRTDDNGLALILNQVNDGELIDDPNDPNDPKGQIFVVDPAALSRKADSACRMLSDLLY